MIPLKISEKNAKGFFVKYADGDWAKENLHVLSIKGGNYVPIYNRYVMFDTKYDVGNPKNQIVYLGKEVVMEFDRALTGDYSRKHIKAGFGKQNLQAS